MIHWPTPDYFIPALEKLYRISTDKIRSVGACNFRQRHLEQLLASDVPMPHVLQIEIHPLRQVPDLLGYCEKHSIAVQAFSPLCKMIPKIRENSVLNVLAEKYNTSIAQLILKWLVQKGVCPVSQSSKVERVKTNFNINGFVISNEDMNCIAGIDEDYKFHLESTTCPGF